MKKNILYIVTFLIVAITANGQMKYGPKIGANMSRFANDKMMPGFHAGGFVNAELMDRMGIQVDFIWALKGNRNIQGPDTLPTTTTDYYRFIEVPVCVYFPISQHIRGFAGPQFNYFRKGNQTVEYGGKTKEYTLNGTGKVSFVAGFDFVLDSPLTIGFRFSSNKFSTSSSAPDGGTTESTSRLNSILISLGYRLDW